MLKCKAISIELEIIKPPSDKGVSIDPSPPIELSITNKFCFKREIERLYIKLWRPLLRKMNVEKDVSSRDIPRELG